MLVPRDPSAAGASVQNSISPALDTIGTFSFVPTAGATVSAFSTWARFTLSSTAPVPEPATWMLMIAGFGLIGAMMRQPRRDVRVRFV